MNWDDLRILDAVRNAGTYAAASARLRIDETTVARRVARLQAALGVTLFDLVDGARRPTQACETICGHIRAMATHAADIANAGRKIDGLVGHFRISATSTIAETMLAPHAAGFLRQNPGLSLQFLTSAENVNFSRWEADVALRLRKPEKGDFSIARLADIQLYLFEPVEALPRDGGAVVCKYPDELDATPETEFLTARGLALDARCVTTNLRVIRGLVASRSAIGVLPRHMCEDLLDDPLLRATPLPKSRELWLLVQNHLKRDRAARAVIDWVRDCAVRPDGSFTRPGCKGADNEV